MAPTLSIKVAVSVDIVFLVHAHGSIHNLLDHSFDFFDEVLFHKTCSIVDIRYDVFVAMFFVNLSHHSHLRRIALQ